MRPKMEIIAPCVCRVLLCSVSVIGERRHRWPRRVSGWGGASGAGLSRALPCMTGHSVRGSVRDRLKAQQALLARPLLYDRPGGVSSLPTPLLLLWLTVACPRPRYQVPGCKG